MTTFHSVLFSILGLPLFWGKKNYAGLCKEFSSSNDSNNENYKNKVLESMFYPPLFAFPSKAKFVCLSLKLRSYLHVSYITFYDFLSQS